MADEMVGKYEPKKYPLHPSGGFAAVCCDFINLGERQRRDKKDVEYLVPACAIVMFAGKLDPVTGDPIYLSREFDVRLGKGAIFREFVEGWRGRPYKPEELEAGIPFHVLAGKPCTLNVVHNHSAKTDRTYANIESAKPLTEGLVAPAIPATFKRAEFWADVKERYRLEAEAYRRKHPPKPAPKDDAGLANEDDLPF